MIQQVYKKNLWTRVVSGSQDPSTEVPLFQIKDDLMILDTTQNSVVRGWPRELKKYFDPEEFAKEHAPLEIQGRYIGSQDLLNYQRRIDEI